MKKPFPLWKKILLGLLVCGALCCAWEFASSRNPYLLPVKRALKYDVLRLSPISRRTETEGLSARYSVLRYGDGEALAGDFSGETDRKTVYEDGTVTRLVNYLDGYRLDFPAGTSFDFTLSPLFTRAAGDGFDATISRERATYDGMRDVVEFELSTFLPFLFHSGSVERHVAHYEYRFLLDAAWQESNRVRVENWTGEGGVWFISAVLEEPGEADYDGYLFATVYTGSREYLRLAYRYHSADEAMAETLRTQAEALLVFEPTGEGVYTTDYASGRPASWTEETAALYDDIARSDTLRWGVFVPDMDTAGLHETVPALEEELDYSFDVVLHYVPFGTAFPTRFMEDAAAGGHLVELTYQLTSNFNLNLSGRTPLLDIYRGLEDGRLRDFARQAAAFGRPFLFRLNNEMNSDWTSYSGVVNLCDPQLFVSVWQRIYRIFQEEGADNCVWIYNPNDRSAPPSKWNDSLAYYPGGEYVQMLGVTGYNNGAYYTQWAEEWREFDQIYDQIQTQYLPHFSAFPWIITEFASSSIGGDKAAWIDNMFAHIGDYPNIKIAVWFSSADYDGDIPARPYWLDETPETLEAFRRGLAEYR